MKKSDKGKEIFDGFDKKIKELEEKIESPETEKANELPRPKGAGYQKRFKKAWQNELFKRNAPRGGEFNPTLD